MSKNLGTIGYCIYCGTHKGPLSREHIIPYGLGGIWILGNASCAKCAEITSKFEMDVLRNTFGNFRISSGLPTRRKKERPDSFTLIIGDHNKREEIINVNVGDVILPLVLPQYLVPAILDGRPHESGIKHVGSDLILHRPGMMKIFLSKKGAISFSYSTPYPSLTFERMLAKIGYGFAIQCFGLNQMEDSYVLPSILNENINDIGNYVGSNPNNVLNYKDTHSNKVFHSVIIMKMDNNRIIARIRLFSFLNTQEYIVVVGKLKSEEASS